MHASTEAILLPTRRPIATLVVCLCASSALLFSGCATERNSRTARTAPSLAAQTRLQSPVATDSARDPAVARTSTATQGPSQAKPTAAAEAKQAEKPETRQEDLNVPVPSPPLIPPRPASIRSTSRQRCGWPRPRTPPSPPLGHGSSRHWHSRQPLGHFCCPRSILAQTITSIQETSSDRPARSSTSPTNHSTSAAVRAPSLPAQSRYLWSTSSGP